MVFPARVNPRTIVLDVDGVLLDFDAGMRTLGQRVLGRPLVPITRHFPLGQRYGLTQEEDRQMWGALVQDGFRHLPMLPGADEAVRRLQDAGMAIHLVTGIAPTLASARLANLRDHGITVDGIVCVGHGLSRKDDALAQLAPIAFVDDRLNHLADAPFVPHRVWIDHGDEQYGQAASVATHRTTRLLDWVEHWDRGERAESLAA